MIKSYFKNMIIIILGCLIMAIGTSVFLLPNKFSTGGVTGIATILYYLFKIPLGTINIIINIPILIFTFYRLGKRILANSIIGAVLYSIFIDLLDKIPILTTDEFLSSLYGGIFLGIGTGLVLNANASTGGTELISNIIKTYNFNIKTSTLIMAIDSAIVLLNVIIFKEIEIGLYSAIAIIIMGKVIDIIVEGTNFSKLIFIISKKNDTISKEIGNIIKRGTTGLYGKGMFKDEDRLILMCATGRGDILKIKQIVKRNDKEAFIIIANAREVLGKGFK
ncbi:MAG: YitT family protein [Clostridia bacterium]|nr:YitT family protein [Clostridium sp.]MEE0126710.1 YitT family protein [Clostridia bacterium]HJJ12146.1 YitT family protein [Clostridiaceae bacterium]